MVASLRDLLQDTVPAATEASYRGRIEQDQGLVVIRDLIIFFLLSDFGIICKILAYRHLLRTKVWPPN